MENEAVGTIFQDGKVIAEKVVVLLETTPSGWQGQFVLPLNIIPRFSRNYRMEFEDARSGKFVFASVSSDSEGRRVFNIEGEGLLAATAGTKARIDADCRCQPPIIALFGR
jgi:hypothetical protein